MNPAEILHQHQIKKTTPRVAIIQALQKSPCALSEAEIREDMGDLYDRATFYRSMQTMADAGILHKIVVDNVTVKYALNKCREDACNPFHAHFYCNKCKKVKCLDSVKFVMPELPPGFKGNEIDIVIKGICNSCNQN